MESWRTSPALIKVMWLRYQEGRSGLGSERGDQELNQWFLALFGETLWDGQFETWERELRTRISQGLPRHCPGEKTTGCDKQLYCHQKGVFCQGPVLTWFLWIHSSTAELSGDNLLKLAFNNCLKAELHLRLRSDHPEAGNKALKLFVLCIAILYEHGHSHH